VSEDVAHDVRIMLRIAGIVLEQLDESLREILDPAEREACQVAAGFARAALDDIGARL
jgi:hypothetical protein